MSFPLSFHFQGVALPGVLLNLQNPSFDAVGMCNGKGWLSFALGWPTKICSQLRDIFFDASVFFVMNRSVGQHRMVCFCSDWKIKKCRLCARAAGCYSFYAGICSLFLLLRISSGLLVGLLAFLLTGGTLLHLTSFFSFLTSSVLHPVIMTRGRRMVASSRWLLTQKTSFFVGICITKFFVLCVSKSQSAVAAHLSPFKTDLCRRMHLFSVPFLFLPSFPYYFPYFCFLLLSHFFLIRLFEVHCVYFLLDISEARI